MDLVSRTTVQRIIATASIAGRPHRSPFWCETHRQEHQPRERTVPCQSCRRPTMNVHAQCGCTTGHVDLIA